MVSKLTIAPSAGVFGLIGANWTRSSSVLDLAQCHRLHSSPFMGGKLNTATISKIIMDNNTTRNGKGSGVNCSTSIDYPDAFFYFPPPISGNAYRANR